MASVAERLGRILRRETPAWGIRPVPPEWRNLGGLDLAVLWFDLSVGLLVMVLAGLLAKRAAKPPTRTASQPA